MQRKRVRTAIATVAVMGCGLLILGIWSAGENKSKLTSVTEYLSVSVDQQQDPLFLTEICPGFTVTGVSPDDLIIGYASDETVYTATAQLKAALQSRGWILESDSGQGVASFSKIDAGSGSVQGCLAQFTPIGQGCALVVQRW
jgi:hypothetical protein